MGRGEVLTLGNLANLVLQHVADGEEGLAELPVVYLGQEVGLVLHGVRTGAEPGEAVGRRVAGGSGRLDGGGKGLTLYLGVVAGGDKVVVVAALLVEGTELDEAVAHDVGVGRETGLYLFHGIGGDLMPVFLMAVDDFQAAAVLVADGGGHLKVFLGGTVPLFLFFGTYLDVEAVGVQSLAYQLVEYHGTVDASREQKGYALVFQIHGCKVTTFLGMCRMVGGYYFVKSC